MSKTTAAATVLDPEVEETPQQIFERELAARFPGRLIKRYNMPTVIKQARAVYLMELTARDEVQAAIYADTLMSEVERRSVKLAAEAERRECVRQSIVGVVSRAEPVAYRHVNKGAPFHEIDTWPAKATTCLQT